MAAPMELVSLFLRKTRYMTFNNYISFIRHRCKHVTSFSSFISSFNKDKVFNRRYLIALPFGFSSKVFASSDSPCTTKETAILRNFEPNDKRLRSSECLKNATGLAVDSTSAVLSQTVYAIIKIEQQYIELIEALISIMEYQMQVLGHKTEVQRIDDVILETRHEIKKVSQRKQDLSLLFSSVEKLADATGEVAFAAGSDFASTSIGERLHSAQMEVLRVQALSEEATKQLVQMEASIITQISKHEEKLKKQKEKNLKDDVENDRQLSASANCNTHEKDAL